MRVIAAIDLELSCWKGGTPPAGEAQEIIEIGFCLYDLAAREMADSGSIYVKPTESRISQYCTDLTGITEGLLTERGKSFDDACRELKAFVPEGAPWISFGDDDLALQRQCLQRGVAYPLSFEHYDASEMVNGGFKELIRLGLGYTKGFGLKDACHLFGLHLQGRQHSGKGDAMSLAVLVGKLYSLMDPAMVAKISSDGSRLRRRI